MSDLVTFKITGLAELQKKLEDMPKTVAKKVLRDDLRAAGEYLKQEMVMQAPYRTGFLDSHFDTRVRVEHGELAAKAFVGPEGRMYYPHEGVTKEGRQFEEWQRTSTGRHGVKGGLVPVVSVARFLEFGTSRMAARPFMTSAFESSKEALLTKIIEGIRSALGRFT